jgi:hypothetical protein
MRRVRAARRPRVGRLPARPALTSR